MIDKCQYGYIKDRKKISWLWLAACIVIGVAIFLAGYMLNHNRANVFTVVAILMVLPAAKRVVNLVVLAGKKGVSRQRYDKVVWAAGGSIVLTDYVFSSVDKVMHLDFLLIRNEMLLAVTAPSRQDTHYLKKYLNEIAQKTGGYKVKIFHNEDELIRFLQKAETTKSNEARDEKVREYLRSLAV